MAEDESTVYLYVSDFGSLMDDYIVSVKYDLKKSGTTVMGNDIDVITMLSELGVTTSDASKSIAYDVDDSLVDLYEYINKHPAVGKRPSVVELINRYLEIFHPEADLKNDKTNDITDTVKEIESGILDDLKTSSSDILKDITDVKDGINNTNSDTYDVMSELIYANIDIIEAGIATESDSFFDWFNDTTATISDPIISNASIMHDQIKKIAEDVMASFVLESVEIDSKMNALKAEIGDTISSSISGVKKYIDESVSDIATDIESKVKKSVDEIEGIELEAPETEEAPQETEEGLLNWFLNILVRALEKLVEPIPDIKL